MTNTTTTDGLEPISYSVPHASVVTGIPKSTIWKLIREGEIKSKKVGRRRLIARSELKRLVGAEA